jgi:NAD-dependent dihydropyrimidine dehydrogenase PreA subunit
MTTKELISHEVQIDEKKVLEITVSWCKACGICMKICPRSVLGEEQITKKVIFIAPEKCNGCGLCELACPDYVFTVRELNDVEARGTV